MPTKRKKKKQATYSGVSVSQLLAQRERDKAMAAANAANANNQHRWPPPIRQAMFQEAFSVQQQPQQQFSPLRPQDPFSQMFAPGMPRPKTIPPWHQARFGVRKPLNPYERVPPLQQHMPPPAQMPAVHLDDSVLRRKHKPKRKPKEPSFLDDPNGYLAQQTALLHSTIARPNFPNSVPLPSNIFAPKNPSNATARPHHLPCGSTACHDCGEGRNVVSFRGDDRGESPVTSTVPIDPRPIQGGAISTSNGSPQPNEGTSLCALPTPSPGNLLVSSSFETIVTAASGFTASSNTVTSVQAGKPQTTSTATATAPTAPPRKSPIEMVQSVVSNVQTSSNNGHILVSSTGQYLGGLKLNQSPAVGTVLVNALPAPFVLQPGVMTVDTSLGLVAGNVLVENQPPLLSPDKQKKKGKKRKNTALGSPILQLPSPNNVVLPQGFGGMQALTLVQGKPVVMNNPINVLQPVVHNFPFQQLLVPGIGNMVMSPDGTTALLQDPGLTQLQLQPVLANTSFITTPAGMLIRSPNNLVSQVSPQEYIQILPQQTSTPAAVVQQNTTIVQQQTTMMANVQEKPLELQIVASTETQHSVSTQTMVNKETSHTFCQTMGSPPDTTCSPPAILADTTTDDIADVSSSVADDKLRSSFSSSSVDESVVSSHLDGNLQDRHIESQTAISGMTGYVDQGVDNIRRELVYGDLVWGAVRGSSAWPGKIISPIDEDGIAMVKWFGVSSSPTKIRVSCLQTLSEGLEAHHRASIASRRTRKLRKELEGAIQEAMAELDRATVQNKTLRTSGRARRAVH